MNKAELQCCGSRLCFEMVNPAQLAIEVMLVAAALALSRRVDGTSRIRFVIGFAALSGLLNFAFYRIAVWPLYMELASSRGIDPSVFHVTVAVETIRWSLLSLVLSRLAVRLQDTGIPGGFVWLRNPREIPKAVLAGLVVGVAASAAMYGVSVLEQRFGYIPAGFWAGANDSSSPLFAVGGGLRNLAGEEVFARLGVQSIALYLLRHVRGGAALAVVASSLAFEFWHNPFERPAFLNFTASVVFGWAYHRRGYEVAAVGHCVADWLIIGLFPRLPFGA
jgi:hypothetical protein